MVIETKFDIGQKVKVMTRGDCVLWGKITTITISGSGGEPSVLYRVGFDWGWGCHAEHVRAENLQAVPLKERMNDRRET